MVGEPAWAVREERENRGAIVSATAGDRPTIQQKEGRKNRATEKRIVLITEQGPIQQMTQEHARVEVITRQNLLNSIWSSQRDTAMKTAAALWVELPRPMTMTGNKRDRRVAERIITYIDMAESFELPTAIFGNRNSNMWELDLFQQFSLDDGCL